MIHPEFRINDQSFSSPDEVIRYASHLSKREGEEEIVGKFISEWLSPKNFIEVQTSGSTGKPKLIQLPKNRVINSAKATNAFFGLGKGTKALLCLSAAYIAGKMMLVRAMIGGWNLCTVNPGQNPLENLTAEFDFTAMVPYQVMHSLKDLYKVKKIIIGGGVISPELERKLQSEPTIAYATYGMTETISHIAVRQVNGKEKSDFYTALPDVAFSQTPEGCLMISAPHITEDILETNDVVRLISSTEFEFLGRKDHVINSGGVKIFPEEIEKVIGWHIDKNFFIAAEKDAFLGEKVILVIENENPLPEKTLSEAFESLKPYLKPKEVYYLSNFSYTETGKIRRQETLNLLFDRK